MAKNTFREPERNAQQAKQKKQRRKIKLATWLNDFIGLDRLFGEDNSWPIRHIDRILWVTFLLILYIGLNHNAERLVRRIQRMTTQVDELRSQFTVLQADFSRSGKQSEISKRVAALGLADSQTPPHKIVVKSDEH
ncbi:FtsL-like putative cell division protein [Spirosoma sp.]|uniref:FtsL-like putative cell division protein n=1 Tax=Spirosoma sp. TaxID=1899569 RepID=UPI003B3A9FED